MLSHLWVYKYATQNQGFTIKNVLDLCLRYVYKKVYFIYWKPVCMINKISLSFGFSLFGLFVTAFLALWIWKVEALYVCGAWETLSYDTTWNPICIWTPERTGFMWTNELIDTEAGAININYGYYWLYLHNDSSVIESDYFWTLWWVDSHNWIINNIWIKKIWSFSNDVDNWWYWFSKCLMLATTWEYIIAGAWDNWLKISLDGVPVINAPITQWSAYNKYWMYPIYLPAGWHLIQYEYNRNQTSETLAWQFIWPFASGSMINYTTKSPKNTFEIANFINNWWTESVTLSRWNKTATAPSNWVDNIIWSTEEEIWTGKMIWSGSYTCPEWYVPNIVEWGWSNACWADWCLKPTTRAATYINTVPTIVINAPTKSSSWNITDTTIRVTWTGIYATWVSIDVGWSSVNPINLACVETTPGSQVDCTILIQQSGILSINAINEYDSANATEPNYVIDLTPPVITITNNVNTTQNSWDEVRATMSDNYCLATWSVFYSYSDDVTCDASDSLNIPYQSNDIIWLYDNTHNGKYICFVAKDCVGNTTYQGTDWPIQISPELVITITAPTKWSSWDITNTTIRATWTGVYDTWISIDIPWSTANPRDLICTNTVIWKQVDCTIVIQQSGDLKINATSAFWNGIWLEQNYIIDKNRPVISIVDDVNTTLNSWDTIVVWVVDDIQLMSWSTKYWFNTGATCDATSIYDTSYNSWTTITLNNNIYNGKYICFTAKDRVGNISYTGSMWPINVVWSGIIISISAPTKSATASITDTTIRVVWSGIYASGITVWEWTTTDPKSLVCTNTLAWVQVDCTIIIQKSGLLKINATNSIATWSATEPNYVIQIPTKTWGWWFAWWYPPNTWSAPVVITPATPKPSPISPKPIVKEWCFTPNNEKTIYQGNDVSALFREAHQMLYNYEVTSLRWTAEYRPGNYLLRQEAAKFMTEFAKNVLCRQKTKTYQNKFNDIAWVDPTLKSYIIESYEYGIFKWDSWGKYTTFRPKEVIKKNELAAIMVRLITNEFSEGTKGDWSKNYRVTLDKYLEGVKFTSVSRANVAEVIYSLYKNNKFVMKDVWYVVVDK